VKRTTKRILHTQSQIIEAAMSFNIRHVVNRYMKDHDIPEEIAFQHERELKRYLVLCALHPYAKYGMRGPVDHLWHTFIFYTKDYFRFCHAIARTYIHHIPEDPREPDQIAGSSPVEEPSEKRSEKLLPYASMLAAYSVIFGEEPPADIWPAVRSTPTLKLQGDRDGAGFGAGCSGEGCASACGNSCNGCGEGCGSCGSGCAGCTSCGSGDA
jgi:hypothetical protein